MLAPRLGGEWNPPAEPAVSRSSRRLSRTPRAQLQGIAMAAATRDGRYRATLEKLAQDQTPEEIRVAAMEAMGSFQMPPNRVLDQLISVGARQAELEPAGRGGRAGHARGWSSAATAGRAVDGVRLSAGPAPRGVADHWPSGRKGAIACWPGSRQASFPKT